jgi:hypothetical protein
MARMLRLAILCITLLAPVSAVLAREAAPDYRGDDGGYLVYAVGTIAIGMRFDFPYRRVALPDGTPIDDWLGTIAPTVGGAWVLRVKNPDFSGRETGHVVVRRLPPGQYLIDQFAFAGGGIGMGTIDWSSAVPFSIRFTIRSGTATYIGSFMRAPSLGTPLEAEVNAAGYFLIADRSERDIPIARAKVPSLPAITTEVTDVSQFGSIVLRRDEP